MDPSYGFGAKPASGLSRPPRLAKLRKPLTGHRPNLARPISEHSGFEQNADGGFVFGSSSSVSGSSSLFSDSALSDLERSKVADDLMRLKIQSEKEKISRNAGGGIGSNVHSGSGLRGVDERVVSELPEEMRRLYIESEYFGKGDGGDIGGDLPNKMKKLNVKGEEGDELKRFGFGGNVADSLSGSSDSVLENKIKDLKIQESLSASWGEKVGGDDLNKLAFVRSGNDCDRTSEDVASSVGNTSSNNSGQETLHGMRSDNSGAGNLYNAPGLHAAGFAFQAGIQSNNGGRDVSYGGENTPMSSTSHPRPVANAGKKVEFSFTSKLDTMAGQNVEFKTPDPKGHFAFNFNRRGESTKDTALKKKKGKWKKPAQVPLSFGKGFGFQDTSHKSSDSPEQYSPMDVSPYEEIPADSMFSRETSVASEESSHIDDNISSTEEHPNVSNDIVDEHLVSATDRLYINESDVRDSGVEDEESSYCVNGGTGVESNEEGAFSGVETESFKSATDELEYSCDSFITAADAEVSSSSSLERQDSDGTSQYKYDASLPDFGTASFVFAASSPNNNESPAPVISLKKKNRIRVGQDSYSSGINVKNSQMSSGLPPFPVSGSSFPSPDHGQKSSLSAALRHGRGNMEVEELGAKLDSATVASIAAQESCEKWRLRGNQAYAKGEFVRAEDYYTQGINCISESEASRSCLRALLLCYSNRAATRMSSGRVKEALRDCMKAAALDPSFLRVQVRAGSCYLALGDVENASLHYMKCLQAGPEACADRKILVEASEGLEKTRKVAECMKQAAGLLERKTSHDIDFAHSLIAQALTISSCSEKLLQMKVDVLLMLKKYEDIIQLCEQLLPMESNFLTTGVGHSLEYHGSDLKRAPSFRVWCCTLILKSYFYLGRLEQALVFVKKQEESRSLMERSERKNLESMIPLVGTIRELLRHKAAGNEAYQAGNHVEAVEHYTASISCSVESRPFAAICFCNRAAAYRAMGQIVDALADCSLAIALDGNYFKAITRRAVLYEMIRDYGQAVSDLQKLVSLLTKEVDKKSSHSTPSDKLSSVNELRQARVKLSEMEEADRKEIPLNMYLILGIDPSAAPSEIRKAYRKAALKYHPDKAGQSLARNENSDDGIWKEIAEEVHKDAERLFKMIGEAYAVLSDPAKRSRYDQEEELRNSPNRGHGVSTSKMYPDYHNYSFAREGPRRQWQDVRRTYEDLRRGPERTWYS